MDLFRQTGWLLWQSYVRRADSGQSRCGVPRQHPGMLSREDAECGFRYQAMFGNGQNLCVCRRDDRSLIEDKGCQSGGGDGKPQRENSGTVPPRDIPAGQMRGAPLKPNRSLLRTSTLSTTAWTPYARTLEAIYLPGASVRHAHLVAAVTAVACPRRQRVDQLSACQPLLCPVVKQVTVHDQEGFRFVGRRCGGFLRCLSLGEGTCPTPRAFQKLNSL